MTTAVGFSATTSGSTPILPSLISLLVRRPIEDPLFPDIEITAQHDEDEQQHFAKRKKLQLAVDNSPGVQKNRFNIKKNEDHRHEIEFHCKPFACVTNRLHAGFVRGVLNGVPQMLAK